MLALLLKLIGLTLAVLFAGWIVPGISVANFGAAAIAGIVIVFVNTFIKPVLILLTLPINILTLGLFILVINALLFMFVAYLVPGIEINSFWSAFWGALVLSILSIGLNWI